MLICRRKLQIFMEITQIIKQAEKWNLILSKKQCVLFKKYYNLLSYYNQKFNLTRITGEKEVLEEHFLDSLAGFSWDWKKKG